MKKFPIYLMFKLLAASVILLVSLFANANQLPVNYYLGSNGPGISVALLKQCPVVDGFDFPVGKPHSKGYYNAQKFRRNNHLGDDWNGVGGGNTDLHDPVYAIADGVVVQRKNFKGGWGRVIRILHNTGTKARPVYIESLYAHMRTTLVSSGMHVKRGQKIGTIGNANGVYWAHLHLEIRTTINKPLGNGYSNNSRGFTDPTAFIKRRRPRRR